jgi:hypothetical protein
MPLLTKILHWHVSAVSEDDGSASSSRIGMLAVIGSACFCFVFFVVKTHQMPDGGQLLGLSSIITAGASLYGLNAWKNRAQVCDPNKGNDNANPNPS